MSEQDTSLYVVATTPAGTAEALRHAARLAVGRRIVLLIPVPYVPNASLLSATLIDDFTAVACQVGVTAHAYALVCKKAADIFLYFPVGPDATIIVGAAHVTERDETQLVEALRGMGHAVVFVAADNGASASPTTDVA